MWTAYCYRVQHPCCVLDTSGPLTCCDGLLMRLVPLSP